MGYYTDYSLNVYEERLGKVPCEESLLLVTEEIKKMNVFDDDNFTNNCRDTLYSYCTKWYKWREDMILLSSKFPHIIFALHGEGEEKEDIWNAYFKGGKMQVCQAQITYPPFCKDELIKYDISQEEYSYQE